LPSAQVGLRVEGHGRPVVLLHGSMSSKSPWRDLIERMRASHRLIAIDLPGPDLRLADEVRRVRTALDDVLESGERFHLVGHSYGAAVALQFAQARHQQLLSLSLFEPMAFHLLPPGCAARAELDAMGRRGEAGLTPLEFAAIARESLRIGSYGRISVPTCLIAGRSSAPAARRVTAMLAQLLRQARRYEPAAEPTASAARSTQVHPIVEAFIRSVDAGNLPAAPRREPRARRSDSQALALSH
jgi:pimeloyl-ACP methyl ester carboxylesterase